MKKGQLVAGLLLCGLIVWTGSLALAKVETVTLTVTGMT